MTPMQRMTYDYVSAYIGRHGFSPTYWEIGEAIGVSYISGVVRIVDRMCRDGYLAKRPATKRSLRVLQPLKEAFYSAALVYAQCPSLEGFSALQEAYADLTGEKKDEAA